MYTEMWEELCIRGDALRRTPAKERLNLLSAPGNDLVAATTLAASACHMVLFTTGRGTPFGTCSDNEDSTNLLSKEQTGMD